MNRLSGSSAQTCKRHTECDPRVPDFNNPALLTHGIWLWFRNDGTYDLVYQAYSGSRARNSPRFNGIDVPEL
jgi:hypothetical protein